MLDTGEPFPLSLSQRQLWLRAALPAPRPPRHSVAAVRLTGSLNLAALDAAVAEIFRRQGSLRTVLDDRGGAAVQLVLAKAPAHAPLVDLSALPDDRAQPALAALLRQEAARSFDLHGGPLARLLLLRHAGGHTLLVVLHPIAGDPLSATLFLREAAALYAAAVARRPSPLPALPVQYAELAARQCDHPAAAAREADLAYWRRQLADLAPPPTLTADRPRPPARRRRVRRLDVTLPAATTRRLRLACQTHGAPLFAGLLAAFVTLLFRSTARRDLAVGIPIAGRGEPGTEALIGSFADVLLLRTRLAGDTTFRELLASVAATWEEASRHQQLPLARLAAALHPERLPDAAAPPRMLFSLASPPAQEPRQAADLGIQRIEVDTPPPEHDFEMALCDAGAAVTGTLACRDDLFAAATLTRLALHFQRLCDAAAAHPKTRLDALPLLTSWESAQILGEWNAPATPLGEDELLLHQLFERQARRTPAAPAVLTRRGRWTYAAVNRAANRLARLLQTHGAGPDVPIAVFMEREIEIVVAVVAILKAGAGYLGLDLSSPGERLAFVVADSAAPLVLTQERLLDRLPALGAKVLCVDRAADEIAAFPDGDLACRNRLDNLHSLVYTSGSTGTPKGTLTTARNYLDLIRWYEGFSRLGPHTRSLLATGINFDASFRGLFSALPYGGATVLADNGPYDAAALLAVIDELGVTTLTCPPSLMHPVIDLAGRQDFVALRSFAHLHLGGEPIVSSRLRAWLQSPHCHCTITNCYGLTETSDVSVAEVVSAEDIAASDSVPIGRPRPGHTIYIQDDGGQPQPIGVPGELCIGGPGVTRGFLHQPALTALRFQPDSGARGARLYRTGDVARWLPDGRIEYLGRRDHQVKVRGHRVELGEIEERLRRLPAIEEAVVLVKEVTATDDKRVVAYVKTVPGSTVSPGELGALLRPHLPEHMIPSAFMVLPELPLNASGKLDRARLPEPAWGSGDAADYAPPASPEEADLAGHFAALLGASRVGVDDNFFRLGGHSLLALQLMDRIRDSTGVEVPLSTLLRTPTVRGLAGAIAAVRSGEATPDAAPRDAGGAPSGGGGPLLAPLQPGGSLRPIFCVHAADGNVHGFLPLTQALGPEQPFYGLQSDGIDGIETMAAAYLGAVRQVQESGPYRFAGWSFGAVVAFEMARQAREAGETSLVTLIEPAAPGPSGPPEESTLHWLARFAQELGDRVGERLTLPLADLEDLDLDDQVDHLLLRAQGRKILPEAMQVADLKHLFSVFQRSALALERYSPRPYSGAACVVLAGQRSEARLAPWRRLIGTGLDCAEIGGDHYSCLRPPHVQHLAETLRVQNARFAREAGNAP